MSANWIVAVTLGGAVVGFFPVVWALGEIIKWLDERYR